MVVTPLGITEFLHPEIKVLVAVSMMALQLSRESTHGFSSSTVIDVKFPQSVKALKPTYCTPFEMLIVVKLPKVGDEGTTEDGHHCVVDSINILKQRIRVIVDLDDDEREAREYGPGDIKFTRRKKKNNNKSNEQEVSAEEMKALKELEKE